MRSQIIDITQTHGEPAQAYSDEKLGKVEKPGSTPPWQDAFGDEEHTEVRYKKVLTWWYVEMSFLSKFNRNESLNWQRSFYRHGGLLMVAETISLGILSLPAAIASLGLVPGLIILVGLGLLATRAIWSASSKGDILTSLTWQMPAGSWWVDSAVRCSGLASCFS